METFRPAPAPDTAQLPIAPEMQTALSGTRLSVRFRGDWRLESLADTSTAKALAEAEQTALAALSAGRGVTELELDGEQLGQWDSSLLVPTTRLVTLAKEAGIAIRDDKLPAGVRNLTALALAVPPRTTRQETASESLLARFGGFLLSFPATASRVLAFLGELVLGFGRLFGGKSGCTRANVWLCLQESGAEALPIVSLISLLVGLILAFVGIIQLGMFGAEIYVSSLVAVGMTRIMGAIMTGIILAGRTGASYAAVIGTMQVNEEIDALNTLGIPPSDYLVLPRLIALTIMTPLLVLYADFMGIMGGFLVGVGVLGLDPMEYFTFTQKGFNLNNLWVGMVHGLVFGMVISITGCYQGLSCGRNAEAVGRATTSAVVYSIVGIVLATAVLTLLCNILKI